MSFIDRALPDALRELARLGFSLSVHHDKLRCSGPLDALPPRLEATLRTNKAQLVECLRRLGGNEPGAAPWLTGRPVEAPLNISQENYYRTAEYLYGIFGSMLTPEGFYVELPEKLEDAGVDEAFRTLFRRHRALGIGFERGGGEIPYQLAVEDAPELKQIELGGKSGRGDLERALEFLSGFEDLTGAAGGPEPRLEDAGFPLFRSAVIHGADGRRWFAIYLDQMICDGVSLSVIYRDMTELLNAAAENRNPVLPAPPPDFLAYCEWEYRSFRGSERHRQNLEFWRRYRGRGIPLYMLPSDRSATAEEIGRGGALPGESIIEQFAPDLVEGLYHCSAESRATLFGVLMAAMLVYLSERDGMKSVAVSSLFANRPPDCREVVGSFSQIAHVGMEFPERLSFNAAVAQVQQHLLQVRGHVNLPNVELLSPDLYQTDPEFLSRGMCVTLTMENYLDQRYLGRDIASGMIRNITGQDPAPERRYVEISLDNFTVYLRFIPDFTNRHLQCAVQYCTVTYRRKTVEDMFDGYLARLDSLVQDPEQLVPA